MFNQTKLCAGMAIAFGGLLIAPNAMAQDAAVLQRVEVTGSNIKRLAAETASPVEVITRAQIKQTGANTVRQILDTVTATTSNELRDDGASNSFASGATGVSMRGLGKGATLVLLNGRRIANFGLADGGQNTFVNIDAIPADVIERIEILKDGASAIYGSDAMAGVMNIITRKEYQGVGISASTQSGYSPNIARQNTVGIVAGKGDMDKDGYNVLVNVEMYKRQGYFLSDVKDYYPSWHKAIVSPAFGDPSLVSWPGNFISPTSQRFSNNSTRIANPACPTAQLNSAGACTTNVNDINQFSDPADRLNFFAAGRLKLSGSMEAFADASFSKTKTDYLSIPFGINAPASPSRWFDGNKKLVQIEPKPLLPVTHPLNTFGRPVGIEYRFVDPSLNWQLPATATQYRVLAGLTGSYKNWDWETSIGRVGADATKAGLAPYRPNFNKAIESNLYKIGGVNSAEVMNSMFHDASITGNNTQDHIDGKITGALFKLPAGDLQAAFGGELRQETAFITSTKDSLDANLIGRGSLLIDGKRTMSAVYGELEAPLLKSLTANVAARYDKSEGYSGVTPKMGLRWEVSPTLLLRGTTASGFRAPNIPEIQGKIGLTGFFNGTLDPKRCDTATAVRDILRNGDANDKQEATLAFNSGCSVSLPAMISANPLLEPERSQSKTLGFVFQPSSNFTVAVDYFSIERRNEISYRDPDFVLAREDNASYKPLVARVPLNGQDQAWVDRANALKPGANLAWSNGQLASLLLNYENFGKTETSGVDVDVRGKFSAGEYGVFNLGVSVTQALSRREWDVDLEAYRPNRVGLRNTPRTKAIFSGSWTKGAWTTGARVNFTSATALNNDETDAGTWSQAACESRLKPGALPCQRDEEKILSLNMAYTGIKDLRLSAILGNIIMGDQVVNLRDGFAIRARTLKLGAEYKF